ncbi:MAG: SGNH/GDSL hydrolase family protein [Acidobacteria bacterium]|nr:SGNH/GDSL hydrolase family protein [Acidobacteriota bacterium]
MAARLTRSLAVNAVLAALIWVLAYLAMAPPQAATPGPEPSPSPSAGEPIGPPPGLMAELTGGYPSPDVNRQVLRELAWILVAFAGLESFLAFALGNRPAPVRVVATLALVLLALGLLEARTRALIAGHPTPARPDVARLWSLTPALREYPDYGEAGPFTVSSNTAGMRVDDAEGGLPPTFRPGARRVLVLGDSTAFGHGLPYRHGFAGQLDALLERTSPPWQVLNGAVPGYTVYQDWRTFERLLPIVAPQVVVLASNNDPEEDLMSDHDRIGATPLFMDLLYRSELYLTLSKNHKRRMLAQELDAFNRGTALVPRVSIGEFRETLMVFSDTCGRLGIRLVIVSLPVNEPMDEGILEYRRTMKQVGQRPGTDNHFVDIQAEWPSAGRDGMYLPGDTIHPNAAGHAKIARRLKQAMQSWGWIR